MNKIVNNCLLAGDKFMLEMHISQPGFTYRASGPITENKERTQQFKERGDSRYIYQNEWDKACFQHERAYRNFEDLTRRSAFDKILRDKAFNIAKNTKYDGYRRGLGLMVYKVFDKKTSGRGIKNEIISNKELAEVLHKPTVKTLRKGKI